MSSNAITRRRALGLLGAGAAAAGLGGLTACAPSAGGDTDTSGKALTDDGVKDFSFTAWSLNEAATKGPLQSIVDRYTAKAGGRVKPASYPYNDYLNQVLLQTRGGTLSGAVQLDIAWVATLAATGKLVDLSSVAGADYVPSALESGRSRGKQYGLPWTSAGIGLIANGELLDRARVDAAAIRTVDDFEQALAALKGAGVTPYAAMTKVDQLKDIIAWMWTFGSDVVADGKIVLGDEPSVAALTWYKKLFDTKLIAPDVNRFDARALMSQGKAAVYDDAIGGRKAVAASSPDKQLADKLVPLPRPVRAAGTRSVNLAWGHVVAVLDGPGAAAATRFAKALTSDPTYAVDWFTSSGLPPTTTAALAAPEVARDRFTIAFTDKIGAFARPDPFWIYPKFAQMQQALAAQVQAILVGKTSPRDGLLTAREQMTALTAS